MESLSTNSMKSVESLDGLPVSSFQDPVYELLRQRFATLAESFIPGVTKGKYRIGLLNNTVLASTDGTPRLPTVCYACSHLSKDSVAIPKSCRCLENAHWQSTEDPASPSSTASFVPWVPITFELQGVDASIPTMQIGHPIRLSHLQFAVAGKRKDIKNLYPGTVSIRSKTCFSAIVDSVIMDFTLKSSTERDLWVEGLNELISSAKKTGLFVTE